MHKVIQSTIRGQPYVAHIHTFPFSKTNPLPGSSMSRFYSRSLHHQVCKPLQELEVGSRGTCQNPLQRSSVVMNSHFPTVRPVRMLTACRAGPMASSHEHRHQYQAVFPLSGQQPRSENRKANLYTPPLIKHHKTPPLSAVFAVKAYVGCKAKESDTAICKLEMQTEKAEMKQWMEMLNVVKVMLAFH